MKRLFIKRLWICLSILIFIFVVSSCARRDTPPANAEVTQQASRASSAEQDSKTSSAKQGNADNKAKVMGLYHDFLSGKITVSTDDGPFTLDDCFEFGNAEQVKNNEYAYFDMNKDGIPELLLNSSGPLSILTVRNDKLLLMDSGYNRTVLRNGAVLSARYGGATTHIDYAYMTYDINGNKTQVEFSEYKQENDDNGKYIFNKNDWFIFNDKTVTKAEWDSLTHPYLSISHAKIDWKPYTNEKTDSH